MSRQITRLASPGRPDAGDGDVLRTLSSIATLNRRRGEHELARSAPKISTVRHSTTSKDPRISYAAADDSPKLPRSPHAPLPFARTCMQNC